MTNRDIKLLLELGHRLPDSLLARVQKGTHSTVEARPHRLRVVARDHQADGRGGEAIETSRVSPVPDATCHPVGAQIKLEVCPVPNGVVHCC